MTETARTLTFVGVAAASLVVAWFASPPVDITPDQLVQAKLGKELFPDFNPNDATSIRVVSFDEARAEPRIFAVEFKNGLWTIPSHHNYPADGATMLSKTANSATGIRRDEFRSASKEDQVELGVVDPLDPDSAKLKGRGQRVTLSKGETSLVDLIIGKQVRDRPGFYYVRVPSEDSTYVAKLDINLSTKFADWVETDLLKLNRDALKEITIDNYSISTDGGQAKILPGEVSKLTRDKSADPWKLDGLDEGAEEIETTKVNDMVSTLDDLKLVGIRPKPKGVNADLSIDKEFVQNRLELEVLLGDLRARGFEVGPGRDDPNQPRLYSRQGELDVATNEGVVYTLRFGEIFSGDDADIETGIEADKKKAEAAKAEKEGEKKDEKEPAAGKQSNRYLFVTTSFDENFLGGKPFEPERPAELPEETAKKKRTPTKTKAAPKIKPGKKSTGKGKKEKVVEEEPAGDDDDADKASAEEKPEDKQEGECGAPPVLAEEEKAESAKDSAAKDEAAKDEAAKEEPKDAGEKKAETAPATETTDEAKPAEKGADEKGADDGKPTIEPRKKPLEQIKKEYEILKEKYEADLKAYEAKVKAGEEKVDDLNRRFGEWYYVISADSFNKLHLARKDLVKAKTAAADDKDKAGAQPPAGSPPASEAGEKPETDAPDDADDKQEEKPEAGDDKPADAAEKVEKP